MSNIKKLMMSAAGGGGVDVDEVFSTYLWTGNQLARNIVNGIDLSTEGGLVWTKNRDTAGMSHALVDTERGANKILTANATSAEINSGGSYGVNGFNADGFSLPSGEGAYYENRSDKDAVGWTFRKAPKFFDVVTYTGNGTNGRTISHNLGSAPGCIIVKDRSYSSNWKVYHRGIGATKWLQLNTNNPSQTGNENWYNTEPTASVFTVGAQANNSGSNFVAYLFAHNNGDGGFGPDGDQDIIKCGGFTTTGTGIGSVDIGFEPQWMLIKSPAITANWFIADNMRGWSFPNGSTDATLRYLQPHSSIAEDYTYLVDPTATGFDYRGAGGSRDYIYMAIRRGSLFTPESGTEVFNVDISATAASGATPSYVSGFPVDMGLYRRRNTTAFWSISSRLTQGRSLDPTSYNTESGDSEMQFDYMTGWREQGSAIADQASWMWKRAPGFFDVVTYTGGSPNNKQIAHNLGVVPELIIQKQRSGVANWSVWAGAVGQDYNGRLNSPNPFNDETGPYYWGSHTATYFSVGYTGYETNVNNTKNIAYLFATLPGVSKVGSYTGNGSSQTINCGFTSGARFILIKRTDSSGDWYIWDTVRGIVAGNDPHLALNTTAAELTYRDSIDPASSGFIVNEIANSNINVSSASYIFYASA